MLLERGEAIDLSHHLSHIAQARKPSPLKGLQKYREKPGIISLAGGLPHPDYFPFSSIVGNALVHDSFPLGPPKQSSSSFSWFWNFFTGPNKEKTKPLFIPKYPTKPTDLSLSTTLQYSLASGIPQLQEFTKEFTHKVYQPAYKNYSTFIHVGNTDGWFKAVLTLCNPGEGVLTSEWTYPSAIAMMVPHGVTAVPVPMDEQGIRSDALRSLLSEWDSVERGMSRPHVMYTVPVGQNPTGIITGAARKKEIYQICVDYDIIIVEDDPYYFLQQGPYIGPAERLKIQDHSNSQSDEDYISQLAPSYLKFDYQGRVIRLDSFSKTIAPGCRMGWFTCNPIFAERLERQAETSTQAPCGFGQGLIAALMLEWRYEGYIRWLKALGIQYKRRRDFFLDCLHEQFRLEVVSGTVGVWGDYKAYVAFHKPPPGVIVMEKTLEKERPMFSFVPPTAGMFVWIKLHFEHHPSFELLGTETLEMQLWADLAEAGVLFGPGVMFAADGGMTDDDPRLGHFRISFSNAEPGDMKKAVVTFASVLKVFFGE